MVFHNGDLDVRLGVNSGLDDLPKFYAIAKIAGQDWNQHVTPPMPCSSTSPCTYTLTSRAGNVALLRLLFDDRYPPQHLRRCMRSEEHTSELQSRFDLVCRLLLEKKK